MMQLILHVTAVVLYALSGFYYWRELGKSGARTWRTAVAFGTVAVLLQGAVLAGDLDQNGRLVLGIGIILSLDAWAVAAIFLAASARKPIGNLGAFIMPTAALAAIGEIFLPLHPQPVPAGDPWLIVHVVVSILAYSLLAIAVVQSLMLWIQERRLRRKQPAQLMQALPPMETMESLMFEMIRVGFILLTLTLISGFFFSDHLFGKPLSVSHHSIFALIAWLVFAILLLGRWRFGWRGRNAVRWTVGGFVFLVFAYLSAQFLLQFAIIR